MKDHYNTPLGKIIDVMHKEKKRKRKKTRISGHYSSDVELFYRNFESKKKNHILHSCSRLSKNEKKKMITI